MITLILSSSGFTSDEIRSSFSFTLIVFEYFEIYLGDIKGYCVGFLQRVPAREFKARCCELLKVDALCSL